jgi:hypothetical protein
MADSHVFNLTTGKWLRSSTDPTPIDPPAWAYGDTRSVEITFVRSGEGARVSVVQSLVSAQLILGSPGSVLTSATAGTPTAAFAYPFTVVMGAAVNTFLGQATSKYTTIEFKLTDAVGAARYHGSLKVLQQVGSDALADPVTGDTALGFNQAQGIYISKEPDSGTRMIWTDESTGQRYSVGFSNGQFQANLL